MFGFCHVSLHTAQKAPSRSQPHRLNDDESLDPVRRGEVQLNDHGSLGSYSSLFQDEYRLPEGMTRIGYDSDAGRYRFRDKDGSIWEGPEGAGYGEMRKGKYDTELCVQAEELPGSVSWTRCDRRRRCRVWAAATCSVRRLFPPTCQRSECSRNVRTSSQVVTDHCRIELSTVPSDILSARPRPTVPCSHSYYLSLLPFSWFSGWSDPFTDSHRSRRVLRAAPTITLSPAIHVGRSPKPTAVVLIVCWILTPA